MGGHQDSSPSMATRVWCPIFLYVYMYTISREIVTFRSALYVLSVVILCSHGFHFWFDILKHMQCTNSTYSNFHFMESIYKYTSSYQFIQHDMYTQANFLLIICLSDNSNFAMILHIEWRLACRLIFTTIIPMLVKSVSSHWNAYRTPLTPPLHLYIWSPGHLRLIKAVVVTMLKNTVEKLCDLEFLTEQIIVCWR